MQEIHAVLRSNDIGQQSLAMQLEEGNAQAIEDLRGYIELCTRASRQIVLHDMIEKRYAVRPYGWPDLEVILLLARLLVVGEINLIMDGALIPLDKAYEAMTSSSKRRRITILQRKASDPKALQNARNLGKDVFSAMGPDGEEALCAFLRTKLEGWRTHLIGDKTLADTGNYPGQGEINDGLTIIKSLLANDASYKFIERFNKRKDDLLDLSDTYHDLEHFYEHQKPTWEKLRKAYNTYTFNRSQLDQDEKAAPALRRMQEILSAKSPYSLIKEAEGLTTTVGAINSALISGQRTEACKKIDDAIAAITQDIDAADGDEALRSACLGPLAKLRSQVERQESIAHISQAEQEALTLFDAAQGRIQEFVRKSAERRAGEGHGSKPAKPKVVVKKVRPITPAALVMAPYLETKEEVNTFLDVLSRQLYDAIEHEERIQIR